MPELRLLFTVGCLLAAMVASAWIGYRHTRLGAVVLLLLSLAWLRVDELWEGEVVLVLVPDRTGLVVADFAGLAGALVAVWLLARGPARAGTASGSGPRRRPRDDG